MAGCIMLSDGECSFLFILDWSDRVTDIRECYPLKREITQRIAAELGIRHPVDIPSRTPLVMTTDFLIDVVLDGRLTLMARAVKRSVDLDKRRVLEKLEIERRYWLEQGVDWHIVTELELPKAAVDNIAWLHGYGSLAHLKQRYPGYLEELAARVLREFQAWPESSLGQFCADIDDKLLEESGTTLALFRHLLARKMLVCAMDEPIEMSDPLRRFRVGRQAGAAPQ